MAKYGGRLTVPTVQFGNLSPEFEVEADTLDSARELWLSEAKSLFARFGHVVDDRQVIPGAENDSDSRKLVCAVSGTEVMFNERTHTYGPGKWLSGSTFAKQFTPEFPADIIAGKIAAKYDVPKQDVLDWWRTNALVSTSFGTALHAALEVYEKYNSLAYSTKGSAEHALPKNPVLREAVVEFFGEHGGETAIAEAFVADPERKWCGQIDRLVINKDGSYTIGDLKTNADIHQKQQVIAPFKDVIDGTKLGLYWLQLAFYASIIEAHGARVSGLEVYHFDGSKWVTYTHEVIDVSIAAR